jgi:general secretion pathway protein J
MTQGCAGRPCGFTLIEVLVAMVVMAIMSLMAWQGVDGIARTRESNQVRLEQVLRLETVIAQWEQDLASIQETTAVPTISCDGQSVRIVRRAEGGLQVIAWSLRPDSQDSVWERWAGPPVTTTRNLQESWFRTQQFQGGETGQLRTLAGLESWRVYFNFGGAWANCQSTGNVVLPTAPVAASGAASTAGAAKMALPGGVRVVLNFAPGSGLAGSLVRDTLIAP